MHRQPSIIKIIKVDSLSFICAILPVGLWCYYLYLILSKQENVSNLLLPAIFTGISLVALSYLLWRISIINSVLAEGIELQATISNVMFFRDRGKINFLYSYLGEKTIASIAVMKTKQTQMIKPGMQVALMVDRNNPKRAFIRDLFSKDGFSGN